MSRERSRRCSRKRIILPYPLEHEPDPGPHQDDEEPGPDLQRDASFHLPEPEAHQKVSFYFTGMFIFTL
jgi:hypothetical protein